MIKINIKEASIEYCVNESITKTKVQQEIQKQLDSINESIIDLEACSNLPDTSLVQLQRYKEHKSELESKQQRFYNEKAKGYAVRARVKWVREGDIPSKYFLSLEKARQANNVIRNVRVGETNYTGTQAISEQIMKFYSKLYEKSDIPINLINKYLNDVNLPNYLMTADCKMCDLDITTAEN